MSKEYNWPRTMDEHAAELAAKDAIIANQLKIIRALTPPVPTKSAKPLSELHGTDRMAASMRMPK